MDENLNLSGNAEIQKALKELESEQGGVETPQVSETVDVLRSQRMQIPQDSDTPKMIGLVMKYSGGLIKEEKQAEYVLIGLVILMFALTFYFLFSGGDKTKPLPVDLQQIDQRQFVR